MNVGLGIESHFSVEHLMSSVLGVNEVLEACFADKEYGADLIDISIGLILLKDSETSKRLHPIRPFNYGRLKRVKHPGTGQIMEIRNSASWDVKPDFAAFSGQGQEGARDYLCEALIASTAVLEEHHDQYPDFDVARFRTDFADCLRAHCGKQAR